MNIETFREFCLSLKGVSEKIPFPDVPDAEILKLVREPHRLGSRLYAALLDFARKGAYTRIFLDTPKNTHRAHRFYEKAGFRQIPESELPVKYHFPYKENDFFLLDL